VAYALSDEMKNYRPCRMTVKVSDNQYDRPTLETAGFLVLDICELLLILLITVHKKSPASIGPCSFYDKPNGKRQTLKTIFAVKFCLRDLLKSKNVFPIQIA